jgi:hypothetical protein
MSKPIVAAICAALAVAFLAFGASGATYYRPSARVVIAAVLKSPSLEVAAVLFRRTPGGRRCVLHGGGPSVTIAVKTCWTDVWVRREGSARVRLMISPPYTKLGTGQTWVFRVSRSLRVKLLRPPTNLGIWAQA